MKLFEILEIRTGNNFCFANIAFIFACITTRGISGLNDLNTHFTWNYRHSNLNGLRLASFSVQKGLKVEATDGYTWFPTHFGYPGCLCHPEAVLLMFIHSFFAPPADHNPMFMEVAAFIAPNSKFSAATTSEVAFLITLLQDRKNPEADNNGHKVPKIFPKYLMSYSAVLSTPS